MSMNVLLNNKQNKNILCRQNGLATENDKNERRMKNVRKQS